MSAITLKDGHGSGNEAKVDDHGRLSTNAVSVSHEQHHSTYHQDLFLGSFSAVLPDTSETNVAFYKNTNSGKDYEFYRVLLSATANVAVQIYAERTYTSGGAAPDILNMNLGSGNVPVYSGYAGGASGDLVLATADEEFMETVYVGAYAPFPLEFKGGLIIPTGHTICITATGSATTAVNATLMFARHAAGYVL